MTASILIEIISVIIALLAFYFTQRNFASNVRTEQSKSSEQINSRVSVLETKIELWWTGLLHDSVAILHHPDPAYARRDELLEKLLSGEISLNELSELRGMLVATIGMIHDEAPGEAMAASILLRLIEAQGTPVGLDKSE